MKVKISGSLCYEQWTVSSDFGSSNCYRIHVKVLEYGTGNFFANKHLSRDTEKILRLRRFDGVSEMEKWDAIESLGVRLGANGLPKVDPPTNTVIDFARIDRKHAAYMFAKAFFDAMMGGRFGDYQNTKQSEYIKRFEIGLGVPCVVSVGEARRARGILVGVKRASKLNPQNWVSFEVNHCDGAVGWQNSPERGD
jgi:hypothetical protein